MGPRNTEPGIHPRALVPIFGAPPSPWVLVGKRELLELFGQDFYSQKLASVEDPAASSGQGRSPLPADDRHFGDPNGFCQLHLLQAPLQAGSSDHLPEG